MDGREEEGVWVGESRKVCGWERAGRCVGGREKEGVWVGEKRKV